MLHTLPQPGGPHKIKLGMSALSSSLRKTLPLPTACSCPIKSVNIDGLKASANGISNEYSRCLAPAAISLL